MHILDFDMNHRGAAQGDLYLFRLTDAEAKRLKGEQIKVSQRGTIRLLEGEVTGHHHEIVMDRPPEDADNSEAIATTALALAKARSAATRGKAALFADTNLAGNLPWLLRRDLIIGFLVVSTGPVVLRHPEHDGIRLPEGTYYVGRQIESAGAEERIVSD